MPIEDYDGLTFVAFLDISGFKVLMRDEDRALRTLDKFYRVGYSSLRNQGNRQYKVDGIFVSDSGVLFVSGAGDNLELRLSSILRTVERINRKLLAENVMLTTSIAYGRFRYHGRLEYSGIEKNPVYGEAYVNSFLDNENGRPKLQPGQCRIIKRNLPDILMPNLSNRADPLFERICEERKHYYFYWMVERAQGIDDFKKQYADAYDLKYSGMLKALKQAR